jgi:crotonobetainyl-CoA:carnitine CoA-transferase CaiB-like acyl-CoA transferase
MQLDGIRIVSFNHFLMGPLGIQFLADIGADVISIEPLEGAFQRHWGPADSKRSGGETALALVANRNKKTICLNLKDPEGLAIARQLVKDADVVAENYRPGVMDKLKLGYEALKAIKPDLIYAAATGFGSSGPYVGRPGQDLIAQSVSGLAWITAKPGETPRPVGTSAIDHHGAVIFAAGILAALVRKARTGEGGRVDVNLLSAALDLQAESLVAYFNGETPADIRQPAQVGTWYHEAPYGIYATSDAYIGLSLGALDGLYEVLEVPSAERIPTKDAYVRRDEVASLIGSLVKTRSFAELSDLLTRHKIWFTEVNDYQAVSQDPQVRHNGDLMRQPGWDGTEITLVSHPVRYDGVAPTVRMPPQPLGAQTRSVLEGLGYSSDAIASLAERGVVGMGATEHHCAD